MLLYEVVLVTDWKFQWNHWGKTCLHFGICLESMSTAGRIETPSPKPPNNLSLTFWESAKYHKNHKISRSQNFAFPGTANVCSQDLSSSSWLKSSKVSGSKSGSDWVTISALNSPRGLSKVREMKAPSVHPMRCGQDLAPIPWTCQMREETPGNAARGKSYPSYIQCIPLLFRQQTGCPAQLQQSDSSPLINWRNFSSSRSADNKPRA